MKPDSIISVFIAEDFLPARNLLKNFIQNRPELEITGMAVKGVEAVRKLSNGSYDLLFLDINFPDMSGIEILEKLDKHPYVIFTTSYDKYAIKAFEIGAIDYLLKPFSRERFNNSVDKALGIINNKQYPNYNPDDFALSFREDGSNYIIAYENIAFFTSRGRHTIIHTEEKCFETAKLLKNIEEKLPENQFTRIHKQYIVNTKFISHLEYNSGKQLIVFIKFDDEINLPVGRTYAPVIRNKLGLEK